MNRCLAYRGQANCRAIRMLNGFSWHMHTVARGMGHTGHESGYRDAQQDTIDLNFTSEWKELWKHAPPRRRASILPQGSSAMLKAPHSENQNELAENKHVSFTESLWTSAQKRVERRQGDWSPRTACEKEHPPRRSGNGNVSHLDKNPRRQTIYIPPEDTTVLTIHPGNRKNPRPTSDFTTRVGDFTIHEEKPCEDNQPVKYGRKSIVSAPKRLPLQASLKPIQEAQKPLDVIGAGHGKENLPPGFKTATIDESSDGITYSKARRVSLFSPANELKNTSRDISACQSPKSPMSRSSLRVDGLQSIRGRFRIVQNLQEQDPCQTHPQSLLTKRRNSLYNRDPRRPCLGLGKPDTSKKLTNLQKPASEFGILLSVPAKYPILEENIEKPEMFEEAWLDHQEVAIQQVVNHLLINYQEQVMPESSNKGNIRNQALEVYQESEFTILRQRLQASLLFGALNPPVSLVEELYRLRGDWAFRRNFVALWMRAYTADTLRIASEVVIGRQIFSEQYSYGLNNDNAATTCDTALKDFLMTCLLDNQDVDKNLDKHDRLSLWRRTLLRSLMLIVLLDRMKERGLVGSNLFQATSAVKSSQETFSALLCLMAPFATPKAAANLNYRLEHFQTPLSEYSYKIQNPATDLRDGVRLTRLVELLLRPPASKHIAKDWSVKVIKRSAEKQHDSAHLWPLSQYLKVPCRSASQKAHNIQIALDEIRSVPSLAAFTERIRSEDIVNGHREKTISLLWALLSNYGVERIVNFDQIRREIHRLEKEHGASTHSNFALRLGQDAEGDGSTQILGRWAQAAARHSGLEVANLTTSFADGRVFAAIVEQYQRFLPRSADNTGSSRKSRLATRLRAIGCSSSFGMLPTAPYVPPTLITDS